MQPAWSKTPITRPCSKLHPREALPPPADEQPASEASEIDLDPDMTGPGHVAVSLNS